MKVRLFTVFVLLAALTLPWGVAAQGLQLLDPSHPILFQSSSWQREGQVGIGVKTQLQGQNVELVGQIGGITETVAVQGNYAYIGVGPHLVILDVSDPAHPMVVGQTGVLPGVVKSIAVAGD
jgi:hypothetical protein